MGLESKKSALASCKFVVVPVPFEKTVCYGHGTAKGPAAVIEASTQIELWDEETKTETWELGINTQPATAKALLARYLKTLIKRYAT